MISVVFDDGQWEVWSDTEVGHRDGRCLASSKNKGKALAMAGKELQDDLERLVALATSTGKEAA